MLIPLVNGAKQIVLIGDHKQLGPTIQSEKAKKILEKSLFERLLHGGWPSVMLDTQYRMHPKIAEFSSKNFYGGKLQNGVKEISRQIPETTPWPNRLPVTFINVEGQEKPSGTSWCNYEEVNILKIIVERLLKCQHISPKDIGINTPYTGQVKRISEDIRKNYNGIEGLQNQC